MRKRFTAKKNNYNFDLKGFSLIEMIIFILIIGICASALMLSLGTLLQKSPTANYQTTAIALAQERMELIFAQKQMIGYSSFTDPCNNALPPSICTALTGYTVISAITVSGIHKIITVTVSGKGNAALITQVSS